MKTGLNIKLGVGVVLFFGITLLSLLLWKPLSIRWNLSKLHSADIKTRINSINGLLKLGDKGKEALISKFPDGENAAKLLLKCWNNVNETTQHEELGYKLGLPIHIAAAEGNHYLAELLVEKGVKLEKRIFMDFTALHCAANSNCRWFMKLNKNDLPTIGYLSALPIYGNASCPKIYDNHQKELSENVAQSSGCFKIAEMLIRKGAEVSAKCTCGYTPLHCAVMAKRKAVVKLLIENGAGVEAKSKLGTTPLHLAIASGNLQIVKLLVINGTDVNLFTEYQYGGTGWNPPQKARYSPLDYAISYGHTEIEKYLRKRGAQTGRELEKKSGTEK
ncbi:MAG: ankyrin repeat domain-containing protein [Planctomycetota bacterium]|nr:MAG: ankyrin repeat domain-containing protein [Planctomycetota bacterium]